MKNYFLIELKLQEKNPKKLSLSPAGGKVFFGYKNQLVFLSMPFEEVVWLKVFPPPTGGRIKVGGILLKRAVGIR